ncbi:OmpA family protein, partial [Xanthomonas perforans]|nr:OmpA family protein [Xanthomonas perforans]
MLTATVLSGGSRTGSNREEAMRKLSAMLWVPVLLVGCGRGEAPKDATTAASATGAAPMQPAGTSNAAAAVDQAAPEFPAIPTIVVPEIVGVTPAQRALEASLQDILDPIEGVSVAPARCGDGGTLITDAGITSVDANGNLLRNGEGGLFDLKADGSGTANFEGGLVNVNADGSGTINAIGEGGSG